MLKGRKYNLPDLFANWPWQRTANPHYDEVKKETRAWIESFKIFGEKELAAFDKYDFKFARVTCDYMHVLLVYDEFTDTLGRDEAEKVASAVIDSMKNPYVERPKGDIIGEIVQQFWKRALKETNPDAPCVKHFIAGFDEFTKAVALEAEDRETLKIRTVSDYMVLRKGTFGAKAFLALLEFDLDLTDEVLEHPLVADLADIAAQLLGITNDIHSYAREQARGLDGHNVITVIMLEHSIDLQAALNWIGEYAEELVARFLSNIKHLPSWGAAMDRDLKIYIDRLGCGVRGQDSWSYETKRYYGEKGEEVRRTQIMTLQAPEKGFNLTQGQLKQVINNTDGSA
ncbi:isoprenoid synthase domain-containing protein [Cyathus striatus]|nr:isoprenoid synthase domain-containing protein [Cyathus striatus]